VVSANFAGQVTRIVRQPRVYEVRYEIENRKVL
jgi:hypothetical protein